MEARVKYNPDGEWNTMPSHLLPHSSLIQPRYCHKHFSVKTPKRQQRVFRCCKSTSLDNKSQATVCNARVAQPDSQIDQTEDIQDVVNFQVKIKQLQKVSQEQQVDNDGLFWGRICLLGVAILWGTYATSLRFILSFENSPSPVALTAIRAAIGAVPLLLFSSLPLSSQNQRNDDQQMNGFQSNSVVNYKKLDDLKSSRLWLAGAELGLWNFLATQAQTMGLQFTTATRAAFLIQATAIFTPTLSKIVGDRLGPNVLIACLMALSGTILLSIDKVMGGQGAQPMSMGVVFGGLEMGDLFILCAAFFYSLATVRLGRYALEMDAVKLATVKSSVLAFVACSVFAVQIVLGGGLGTLASWSRQGVMWGVVVWSAVGPGMLAALLQTRGQSRVPASQAQVVYSVVPLFSSLWAYLLLGERGLGAVGWIGGLLVMLAGLVISIDNRTK
eukprot:TRINITY_DN6296_c0_g1_i1.p1 TRINITY_DN6296_c0_g1~~TRINITY_DN6296_c0_g1_i1.p1  ORF type:complete len:467 (-),score=47.37 TRINITY_DN6296_c0_g1_i1:288-1619(-)